MKSDHHLARSCASAGDFTAAISPVTWVPTRSPASLTSTGVTMTASIVSFALMYVELTLDCKRYPNFVPFGISVATAATVRGRPPEETRKNASPVQILSSIIYLYNALVTVRSLVGIQCRSAGRRMHRVPKNNEAIRQGVMEHLAKNTGLDVNSMNIDCNLRPYHGDEAVPW